MRGPTLSMMGDLATEDDVVLLRPETESVPESDGHRRVVDLLAAGLEAVFVDESDVLVCCRMAWFPDPEDTHIRLDPDVMLVRGRPKGERRSYKQWVEEDISPQLLIEVVSEHDTDAEYRQRLDRAREYGVEEVVMVYLYAPAGVRVERLVVDDEDPSRFRAAAVSVDVDHPIRLPAYGISLAGGRRLVAADALGEWPGTADGLIRLRAESRRAAAESARADAEARRADAESARAERLARRLREAGLDPDV